MVAAFNCSIGEWFQFRLAMSSKDVKLPRPTWVNNKTPAPVHITAEQILREARDRQEAEIFCEDAIAGERRFQ